MSTLNLHIRVALPEDADILLVLIASAYRGEESRKGWTTEADLVTDDRIDKAGLLAKISQPNGTFLLATDDSGALVACCELLKVDQELGYFGLFAVNPLRQGGGLGKLVLQSAEDFARGSLGLKKLEMSVIWTRQELIAWYIRRGYAKTGEQRPFPYEQLANGRAGALRDDLYFEILEKDLTAQTEAATVG